MVNPLSAAVAGAGFVLYVFVYTPLKRLSSLCTLVGAVPGAVPPLSGWAAATGSLDPTAWILFSILFLWQMPHFFAIARLFREDYRRGGMAMIGITMSSTKELTRAAKIRPMMNPTARVIRFPLVMKSLNS
jgi:protoheme IX farnesyltransferase